jgi:hypothetical protein
MVWKYLPARVGNVVRVNPLGDLDSLDLQQQKVKERYNYEIEGEKKRKEDIYILNGS